MKVNPKNKLQAVTGHQPASRHATVLKQRQVAADHIAPAVVVYSPMPESIEAMYPVQDASVQHADEDLGRPREAQEVRNDIAPRIRHDPGLEIARPARTVSPLSTTEENQ